MQIHSDQSANFGRLHINVCVAVSQCCLQQHKSLKVTRNATNPNKHLKEACKQNFAKNMCKTSCNHAQGMLSNWMSCFNATSLPKFDNVWCVLSKTEESVQKTTNTNFPV